MIGSGLKKLAAQYGMKVSSGVAYGDLRGYAVTLWEGSGFKAMAISANFTDQMKAHALSDEVAQTNISREYRVQRFNMTPRCLQIAFLDNPGTLKKIEAFIDFLIPMLQRHGIHGSNVCSECGGEMTAGKWVLVDGIAHHMHESCASHVVEQIRSENEAEGQGKPGNYFTGFLGALLGSAIGAVLWAVILNLGYVASIVGFVIGWLAEKGYNLLHGKQGKLKAVILCIVVILGVLLGTFAADAFTLLTMIQDGSLAGFELSEIPAMIFALFAGDAEYRSITIKNVLMGLLFAALGVFSLIWKAGKDASGVKVKYLD